MKYFVAVGVLAVGSIVGCAPELTLVPTELTTTASVPAVERFLTFTDKARIKLSSGYSREISEGSKWKHQGNTQEGAVFKPVGFVFTIEGAHVREAQIVIHDNKLVGFYLPGDNSFSPLNAPISISAKMDT